MDLARWSAHEAWLRHVRSEEGGTEPPPGYKDCKHCPIRPTTEPSMREDLCRACPYEEAAQADGEDLPASPGERFFLALELSGYPPEAINYQALSIQELKDLQTLRQYNAMKRDQMLMQAAMGGAIRKVVPGG